MFIECWGSIPQLVELKIICIFTFSEDGFPIYFSGSTKWAKVRNIGPVLRKVLQSANQLSSSLALATEERREYRPTSDGGKI
jgi:hypothetical protein